MLYSNHKNCNAAELKICIRKTENSLFGLVIYSFVSPKLLFDETFPQSICRTKIFHPVLDFVIQRSEGPDKFLIKV